MNCELVVHTYLVEIITYLQCRRGKHTAGEWLCCTRMQVEPNSNSNSNHPPRPTMVSTPHQYNPARYMDDEGEALPAR